jgi:hypothetical protein
MCFYRNLHPVFNFKWNFKWLSYDDYFVFSQLEPKFIRYLTDNIVRPLVVDSAEQFIKRQLF